MKKALLLDVSAIMYRAYFSLINMRNSKKEPTGAVYGFFNILQSAINKFEPDYIGACFDVKRDTLKRREVLETYKDNRSAMPEDLRDQIAKIEQLLDIYNIKRFKMEGFEADDLLGTVATKCSDSNIEAYILTGDKDLSQVLNDNINVVLMGKGGESFKVLTTDEDVKEQLGVLPKEIPDLFGLQGDSSDGIPGVKGVGPKGAIKLLAEYDTLEGIYENIDSIKGALQTKLINGKEMAFISRELAIIDKEVPMEFGVDEIAFKDYNSEELLELFTQLEFKTFIKKMNLEGSISKKPEEEVKVTVVNNEEELKEILSSEELTLIKGEAGIAIEKKGLIYYVPLAHNYLGATNLDFSLVKDYLTKDSVVNSYDIKRVMKSELNFSNGFDAMLGYYILNPDDKFDLEKIIFNVEGEDLETYKSSFGKEKESYVKIEELALFYGKRVKLLADMKPTLIERLKDEDLFSVYEDIEMKLLPVLDKMEKNGIMINLPYFKKYDKELLIKISSISKDIFEISGKEFNLNSPKQLSEILFVDMGILPVKKTKTGFSTNSDVLETLAGRGEKIAEFIIEYRKLAKLHSTYVSALPKLADQNGRIHTTFNQNGTGTGRLSSTEPNLQNIPVKSSEGIKIREGFVAREGYSLVTADYSQVELRLLAEISKDETLIDAYKNGLDLHDLTARRIFDKDDSESVERNERSVAKIVNFSIIYGKTPFGLAGELGISMSDAKSYIEKYFEQYSRVKAFIDESIEFAKENLYVKTLFNRKRTLDNINSRNKNLREHAERTAVNTIIQGTAADILKIVMIKLDEKLSEKEGIYTLLQVHDELIFEIRDDKIDEYSKLIKDVMENSVELESVHLDVNINVGKNWAEAK